MPNYCECYDCENREAIYWVLSRPAEGDDRVQAALEYQMFRHNTATELGWMMICQSCLQFYYEGGYLSSEHPEEHEGLESSDQGHEWWKRLIEEEVELEEVELEEAYCDNCAWEGPSKMIYTYRDNNGDKFFLCAGCLKSAEEEHEPLLGV
jgi:hypothetical protein